MAQYPEINWFPGIVTRKSINVRVSILGNVQNISEKICWFLPRFQVLFTKVVFLENVLVLLPGNQLISGSWYSEINWFPGIVTRKSIYDWVTIPGNQFISRYGDPEIATKKT